MSDSWEFYPCQMGELTAFVFVNVSISERLKDLGRTEQVMVRIRLKHPRADGLTTNEEFQQLSDLEDGFTNYCATAAADMVGRVTVGGYRDFVVYADKAEPVAHGLTTIARDEHGYEIEVLTREDPEFEVYWTHLYPSPIDWQLITNAKLLDQLEEHGDSGEVPRRVDHWLHFEQDEHRAQFERRILGEGFAVEAHLPPTEDDPRFGLQIHREHSLGFAEINELTVRLCRLAEEFGGSYDGWETAVVEG